jgi:MFS family permease
MITSIKALSFREAFTTRQFWFVYSKFFCLGFCTFAIIVHIVPHSIKLGISAVIAANILATVGGLSVVGRVVLGRVADHIGNQKTFIIGFALMAAALFGLIPAKTVGMLYLLAGAFGLAYGTCVASQSPLVAELFGLSSHGVILGFLSFGFTTGGAIGPWLAGHLFDITDSYRLSFTICSGISLAGLILTMCLKPGRT